MLTRQRITTYGISTAAAATVAVAALLSPWAPSRAPGPGDDPVVVGQPTSQPGPAIDVVFAIDTTASMSQLIEGAKRTTWAIASHIRETEPNADLRIGLVAFRDVGDLYVTKPFALTGDLDAVYAELTGYFADGGGDHPESVGAALRDALAMRWRPGAKKLIFLVGDAPPGDGFVAEAAARDASMRGIRLNTIRAGTDYRAGQTFQQLAALGNGDYSSIHQHGGVRQVATPYDGRLAELSARIDSTAIIVGDDAARHRHAGKMAAAEAAPAPAKADRAAYYAKKATLAKPGSSGRAAEDLVTGVETGAMRLDDGAPAALPAELRGKDARALEAEVARRAAERKQAQEELNQVAKRRAEFLRKNATDRDGFDAKVKGTLDAQLK